MGSLESLPPVADFVVLDDVRAEDKSLPAFMVSKDRGFLPRMDPVAVLPAEFDALESLLARMPVKTLSGGAGLLAAGKLGDAVAAELPDLTDKVELFKDDLPLMNALYRDYSFLASAYLLEPCHLRFVRGEPYGLGRQVLPANIARPIARCAELCQFQPFMEYAGSYALFNYRLEDPARGLEYSNLRLIRAFEHGLDPTSSEAGFVLVHIDMVRNSGPLVAGTMACIEACCPPTGPPSPGSPPTSPRQRREALNAGLATVLGAMRRINGVMETMWNKSKPGSYTSFRTFIFGITSQTMFPDGVVYEGVSDGKAWSFRGESGANDSMIPLMDNLLQIPMPATPLTEILRDFRKYRPSNHRQFLQFVKEKASEAGVRDFALALDRPAAAEEDEGEREAVRQSRVLWLQCLDQVREFRFRHWKFGVEYILKQTSHPTATGGSPIVTWLPNQLQAVLAEMTAVRATVEAHGGGSLGEACDDIMDLVGRQTETLAKEVQKYCEERGVVG